ncbi:uncharacterized protein LOC135830826 [Sycon ciliatum]|uniref:uncharacterized protein LOC135830826 n=1 Tax=Sycon ciliatum TaxID=27933 RepID=UPI0031F6A9FE
MVAFEIRGEMCHVLPEPNPKDRRFPFYWCYSFNNTSNLRLLLVLLFCYVAKLDPWRKLDKARLNSGSTCPEEAVDPSTKFMITSLEETIRQRYEGALARLATAQLLAQTRSVKGTRRLRNPSRREITRSTTPTPGRESPVGTIALCGKEPQTAASGKSIPDMTVINMQSAEDRPGVPAERVPAKSESLVQKRLQVEKDDRQLAAMIDQESEHQAQISSSPSSPSHDNDSSEEQQQGGSTYRLTDHQQPPVSAREQLVKARSVLSGPTREARRKSIDRHPTEHEGIPPRPKTRLLEHSSEDGKAGYPGRPAAAHPARSIPAYQGNAAQQGHDARQRVTRRNTPLPPRGLQEWQGMDYVDAKLGQTAIAKVRQHAAEPMTGKDVAASFPSNGNTMHRPKLTAPLGKHQPVESSDTSQGETAHPPTCRKAAASLQSRHTQSKPGGHVIPQVPSSDVESEVSTLTDDTLSHRIPGSSSRHRSQRQRTDVEHRQPSHMQHAALPLWEHEPVVSRDPAPELSQTHQEMQEVRQRLHARDLAEQQEYAKLKSKVCDQLHLEWNNGRAPPASSGKPRALPPLEPRPRAAKPAHLRAPPVDVGVDNESELSSGPVAGEVSDQDTAKQQQPELLEQAPAPTSLNATTLERHEAYQRKQAQAQAALDPTAVEQEKQQQQDVQTRSFDEPAGKTIVKNGSIVRTVHYEPHTDTQMRKTITETDNASGNTLSMHVVLQELGDDAPHYHTTDYRYRGSEASYHGQRPVRDHSYMYSQTNGFGAHEPATTSSSASLRQASASRNPTRVQQLSSAMHTDPSTADSSSRLNKIATGSTLATAAAAREAARAADPPVMWLPKRQHHGFNMSGTRVKDCTEQMERVSEYFGKHGAETSQQPALQDMNDFQTMTGSTGQPISSSRSAYEERSSSYQTPQQQHANGRPFFSATSVGSRGRRYAGTGDQRSRPLKGGTGTVRNTGSKVGDASGKFVAPKQRTAGGSNVPLFSGVVAYTDPSNKSNRQLIRNSIKHVCLAGLTNQKRCTEVLETLEYSLCKHFLVLVREVPGCQFRALYEVDQGWKIRKLVGRGPLEVQVNMIDKLYKYNSGAKAFALIESRTLSASIDAFSLNAVFWKGKAPT